MTIQMLGQEVLRDTRQRDSGGNRAVRVDVGKYLCLNQAGVRKCERAAETSSWGLLGLRDWSCTVNHVGYERRLHDMSKTVQMGPYQKQAAPLLQFCTVYPMPNRPHVILPQMGLGASHPELEVAGLLQQGWVSICLAHATWAHAVNAGPPAGREGLGGDGDLGGQAAALALREGEFDRGG